MRARWWDEGDEPLEKLAGLEDDVRWKRADALLEVLAKRDYTFVLVNHANPDMF